LISSGKQTLDGCLYKATLRIRNRAYKFDGTALGAGHVWAAESFKLLQQRPYVGQRASDDLWFSSDENVEEELVTARWCMAQVKRQINCGSNSE
jgi:hypothetical protein